MTRACNTLLWLSLASLWSAVSVAQPAATPPATPAPTAAEAAATPPAAQAPASAPAAAVPTPPAAAIATPAAPAVPAPTPDAAATPEVAPAAVAAEPQPEPAPEPKERKASFLDPHPAGLLPPLYSDDMRTHQGLSVRVSAGLGFGATRRKLSKGSYKVSGLEGVLSLDIGTSVIDNLIVYGRITGFAWNSLRESDTPNAGGAYLGMLGAGARYYLMPHNVFASATVGLAATQVIDDLGVSKDAHPGVGFELELGRDFWAGTPRDRRAVGLSLRFGYVTCGAANTGQKDPKAWNSVALSILFSAAYN